MTIFLGCFFGYELFVTLHQVINITNTWRKKMERDLGFRLDRKTTFSLRLYLSLTTMCDLGDIVIALPNCYLFCNYCVTKLNLTNVRTFTFSQWDSHKAFAPMISHSSWKREAIFFTKQRIYICSIVMTKKNIIPWMGQH
jgi:hypothetical protein